MGLVLGAFLALESEDLELVFPVSLSCTQWSGGGLPFPSLLFFSRYWNLNSGPYTF
jgi:hypothetical protein